MPAPSTTKARAALEALRDAWDDMEGPERDAALGHINGALAHLAPIEQWGAARDGRLVMEAEQAARVKAERQAEVSRG